MKLLSVIALFVITCVVFALLFAVLENLPAAPAAAAAAQDELTVPLSGAPAAALGAGGAEAALSSAATTATLQEAASLAGYPGLDVFASGLVNGSAADVVGVYVRDIMALPVEQQPSGLPDYVASEHNLLTEFQMPKRFGSVGILAHNFLSGSRFTQLSEGTEIVLVYGDGRAATYKVTQIDLYQALEPNSPVSEFVHPNDPTRAVLSSAELFQRVYTTPNRLVFQTCVEAFGDPSWGRMFVTAEPVGQIELRVPALPLPGLN